MKIFEKALVVTGVSVCVGLLVMYLLHQTTPKLDKNRSAASDPPEVGQMRPSKSYPYTSQQRATPNASILEQLKQRWRLAGPLVNYTAKVEHHELARDSIKLLMCSEDLIVLMDFLKLQWRGKEPMLQWKGIENSVERVIYRALLELFRSADSQDARNSLLQLGGSPHPLAASYREKWSYAAGHGCPPELWNAFITALADRKCVQSAVFGRDFELVKTDPIAALSSTVAQLDKKIVTDRMGLVLFDLMRELPPGSDFAELEKILPPDEPDDPFPRMTLFEKWGAEDPAAAANYILANPGRVSPSLMTSVALDLLKKNPAVGIEWIQNIPEGPYFDAAAISGVMFTAVSFPDQARELASLITDPEIRKAQLKHIDSEQAR